MEPLCVAREPALNVPTHAMHVASLHHEVGENTRQFGKEKFEVNSVSLQIRVATKDEEDYCGVKLESNFDKNEKHVGDAVIGKLTEREQGIEGKRRETEREKRTRKRQKERAREREEDKRREKKREKRIRTRKRERKRTRKRIRTRKKERTRTRKKKKIRTRKKKLKTRNKTTKNRIPTQTEEEKPRQWRDDDTTGDPDSEGQRRDG